MGCDIHCFVERRNKEGSWETLKMDKLSEEDLNYLHEHPEEAVYYEESEWMFHLNQNYFLFAILADVRNYWHSDNIKEQGCQVIPISEPKGLPNDVTERVKKASDRIDSDGHSHSYLTLNEIMNYSWGQIRICEDMLTDSEYDHYLTYGDIEYESIHGVDEDVRDILSSEQLEQLSEKWMEYIRKAKRRTVYFTHAYCCRDFLHVKVPMLMAKLGEVSTDLDDIRMVFWFDN